METFFPKMDVSENVGEKPNHAEFPDDKGEMC